jgi:hypothetical protein
MSEPGITPKALDFCSRDSLETVEPGLYVIIGEYPDPIVRFVYDAVQDAMERKTFSRVLARVRDDGRKDFPTTWRTWTRKDGKTVIEIED